VPGPDPTHLPPGGYQPGPPPVPPKKGGSGKLIGIVAGVIGLVLVVAWVFGSGLLGRMGPVTLPIRTTSTGATVTPAAPAGLASDTVRGYLGALAAGNAEQALEYADVRPDDLTFLTDQVLAVTNAAAPISGINVPAATASDVTSVTASFMIGSTSVTVDYPVTRIDGVFKMVDVVEEVDLSKVAYDSLPLKLAGVRVSSPTIYLFPGFYPAGTFTKNATYGKGLLVKPEAANSASALKPSLTSAGTTAVRNAAKKKLAACLKVDSLTPKGCSFGIRVPATATIRKSTISWKVSSGSFSNIKPKMAAGDPGLVTAKFSIRIRFDARDTRGRSWYGYAYLTFLSADITGTTPVVTFD
jgi:hypothetical protein